MSLILLADDLTGALDSAAPFASRGFTVEVAPGVDAIPDACTAMPDVLAVDTRTRAASATDAAEWMRAVWNAIAPHSPRVVMKKVDSRLKGQVAAETAALLKASGRTTAAICPAVPEHGRIVMDGALSGTGIDAPLPLATRFTGVPASCHDAADASDLTTLADTILAAPSRILAVGARGLAVALADRMAGPVRAASHVMPKRPMVMAIGSRDPITLAQIERLLREHPDIAKPGSPSGRDIVLLRPDGRAQSDPIRVAEQLAERAATLANAMRARTIFCSGGDTAAALVDALGARRLIVEGEMWPGVPIAPIAGADGLRLVTKSGGFGDPALLSRLVDRMARVPERVVA